MSDQPILFGKYHEVALLVIGFCLTTIVGSFFQNRSWNHQYEIERNDADKEAASRIVASLSDALDTRTRRMRQLADGYRSDIPANELGDRLHAYRVALDEWNFSLNRNLRMIERYFGSDRRNELEGDIQSRFIAAGRALELLGSAPRIRREQLADSVVQQLDSINTRYYQFIDALMYQVANNEVGARIPSKRE